MRFIETGQTSYNNIGSEEQRGLVEGFFQGADTVDPKKTAFDLIGGNIDASSNKTYEYISDLSLNDLKTLISTANNHQILTGTITGSNFERRSRYNNNLVKILNRLDASYNVITSPVFSLTDMKNQIKQLKDDIASAKLRKEAIEKQEEKTSYYQLFGGFARPLRTISVPVLISITVMLMFISILSVFYVFKGSSNSSTNSNIGFSGSTGSKNSNNMFKRFGLKTL